MYWKQLFSIGDHLIRARNDNLKGKCKSTNNNFENDFWFDAIKNRIFQLEHQITKKDTISSSAKQPRMTIMRVFMKELTVLLIPMDINTNTISRHIRRFFFQI